MKLQVNNIQELEDHNCFMKIDATVFPERILFAISRAGIVPLFATGKISEMEVYEYSSDRNWNDESVNPPRNDEDYIVTGIWVWEYTPSVDDDGYVDLDNGSWRKPDETEWYLIKNGEPPWRHVSYPDKEVED